MIHKIKTLGRLLKTLNLLPQMVTDIHDVKKSLGSLSQVLGAIDERDTPPAAYRLPKDMADRGLFIIGHGRSGTTIFWKALNCCSREIFLLGEMSCYNNFETTDFISRYNAVREKTAYESPDSASPKVLLPQNIGEYPQSFWSVMAGLFENHRYVGEKMAFGPWVEDLLTDRRRFLSFQRSYFPRATYICLFRNPNSVILSLLKTFPIFQNTRDRWRSLQSLALSYFVIIELFFTMPVVPIIEHEKISQATFIRLSEILQIDVASAFSFYSPSMQHKEYKKEEEDTILFYDSYNDLLSLYENIVSNINHDQLTFIDATKALYHYRTAFQLAKAFEMQANATKEAQGEA